MPKALTRMRLGCQSLGWLRISAHPELYVPVFAGWPVPGLMGDEIWRPQPR